MLLENVSASPITLAGYYTIPAGTTQEIPYASLEDDRTFVSQIDAQNLRVVDAEESFTLRSLPRFTQGLLFGPLSLTAGETGYVPQTNNGTTPVVLWLAPFQNVRLYMSVTSGDATATILDSPDGGQTFYPVPDAGTLTAAAGDENDGKMSLILPHGLCLIQVELSSTGGGIASVSYSRQT